MTTYACLSWASSPASGGLSPSSAGSVTELSVSCSHPFTSRTCIVCGTSSSALLHTWAVCALPTLTLSQRYLNKDQSFDSGPARSGLLLVSPMCPSSVPTRSRQSRSRDGKAVVDFPTYFPSCTGLRLLAEVAKGVEESVWVCLFKLLFLWTLTGPLCLGRRVHPFFQVGKWRAHGH